MQANQYNVVQTPRKVAHWLHFVLSIITFGLWIPVWICVAIYTGIMNARSGRTRIVTTTAYPYPPQVSATPASQGPTALPPAPSSQTPQLTPGSSQTPSGLWVPAHTSNRQPSTSSAPDVGPVPSTPPSTLADGLHPIDARKKRGTKIALGIVGAFVALPMFFFIVAGISASTDEADAASVTSTTEAAREACHRRAHHHDPTLDHDDGPAYDYDDQVRPSNKVDPDVVAFINGLAATGYFDELSHWVPGDPAADTHAVNAYEQAGLMVAAADDAAEAGPYCWVVAAVGDEVTLSTGYEPMQAAAFLGTALGAFTPGFVHAADQVLQLEELEMKTEHGGATFKS